MTPRHLITCRAARVLALVALTAALHGAGVARAQSITRGPYLQLGTSTSVTVRWRTDVATDSRAQYGASPMTLTTTVDDLTATTEHVVALGGLAADTRYYYSVGTTTGVLAGGDVDHTFLTAPVAGTAKPTRVWVIGDSGTADANAAAVRDAYDAFPGAGATDLWLMLGDNAYVFGTDVEYQAAVFDMYPSRLRSSVLWPTFGNHDNFSSSSLTQTGPYYDSFTLPKLGEAGGVASGTEAYYSFDYANIHFICLDSEESDRSPGGAMMSWLTLDLQAATAQWIIAFWHHPPYSKGSHNSDIELQLVDMRQNALPILEAYGVDLVLTGHSHSYERSFLLDGHYGVSTTLVASMLVDGGDGRTDGDGAYRKWSEAPITHEGAVYAVAGSSGQISGGTLDHPAMFVSLNELGSLVLDVDGPVLTARFLNSSGVVRDHFTIVKSDAVCDPTPRSGCRAAPRSLLKLHDRSPDDRDELVWKWLRGAATPVELGDPTVSADYGFCVYDQNGPVVTAQIAASASRWSAPDSRSFAYDDPSGNTRSITDVLLKGSVDTHTKLVVRGRGAKLQPAAGMLALPVVAQLVNSDSGVCWESRYNAAIANSGTVFKAKLP
jgi:acid phosphatase type 7